MKKEVVFRIIKKWNDAVYLISLKEKKVNVWFEGLDEDVKKFIKFIAKKKIKNILDVGCGDGRNAIPLAEHGFYTIGLDISPKGLKVAQKIVNEKNISNIILVEGNMTKLPFVEESFDSVLSSFAIGEMLLFPGTDKKDLLEVLKEIYRVLKKKHFCLLQLTYKVIKEYKIKNVEDKIIDKQEYIKILKNVGFKIINISEDNFRDPPHSGATHGYNKPHTHFWLTILAKK